MQLTNDKLVILNFLIESNFLKIIIIFHKIQIMIFFK